MCALVFLFSLTSSALKPVPALASVQDPFPRTWQNVAIGGGGYVTNIYIHPQLSDIVYIQTDNGGFYRWDQAAQKWHPITDHFTLDQKNYYGGAALALDAQNPDVILIAVGQYVVDIGTVFRSDDRGKSWQPSDLRVPMGADQEKRWAGHRLEISPLNSNIVLFGSRQSGLWRSQDGGATWQAVKQLAATPDPDIGLIAIAFDPSKPGHVVLGSYEDGLYESFDDGLTWQKMARSPTHPMRIAISHDGILYVTSDRTPGVSRYHQGRWSDITPFGYESKVFNGLTVHPTQANQVIVSIGEDSFAEIFHSQDFGTSWQQPQHKITNTVPWWPDEFFKDHTSAIKFSPRSPEELWLTDWFGIWKTNNFSADPVRWQNYQSGHEQVVVFSLISPPQGALLLSGVADVNGFRHHRLNQFPSVRLRTESGTAPSDLIDQDTFSLAYSANDPQHMVRVGGKRWNNTYGGYLSDDGGETWVPFPTFPAATLPLRIALSSTNTQNFLVVTSESTPLVTLDGGQSWQSVTGLPKGLKGPWTWNQPLAADGGQGNRYYYYSDGQLYRSDDYGLSFTPVQEDLPVVDHYAVHTMPGCAACIWVSLGQEGLHFSTDGGVTLTKIPKVTDAHLFSLGKGVQGRQNPAWYVYGTIDGLKGIFVSTDQGQTWSNISEPQVPIGAQPRIMEASKQRSGLIFIGTNGRGIYYKQVRLKEAKA